MEVVKVLACTLDKPGIFIYSLFLLKVVPENDV
jgi:hypothetical protein